MMQNILDGLFSALKQSELENDPIFLTVFILLSYKQLVVGPQSITIGSTILTACVAAAASRLAPIVIAYFFDGSEHAAV